MEIANIPLEEVGGGGGGAKYPNIGSDPGSQLAAASKRASPPPNISANEIPRYTRVLLTQRFLSLQLSLLARNWMQCEWNSNKATQLMLILKIMPFFSCN